MKKEIQEYDVELVPVSEKHIRLIFKHLGNDAVLATYPETSPFTLKQSESYVSNAIKGRLNGTRFAFAIKANKTFAGICALYNIDQTIRKAALYYWVAVEFWNQGIATKALKKLIAFGKEELGIQQFKTGVLERNVASVRVLEKNGFTVKEIITNNTTYHPKFKGERFLEMKLP